MYVVIVGGGRIGRHIARDMVQKGNRVTVVEREVGRCDQLVVDHDVLVIEGDAGDIETLRHARTDRADVFVATTHDDEDNLVACELAVAEFEVKRAIARVNSPKNVEIFEVLGIEAVSSTRIISELLESEFTVGDIVKLTQVREGRVVLLEIQIPNGTTHEDEQGAIVPAPPVRTVQELGLPDESVLAAIFRGSSTIVPHGGAEVRPGDEVVALTIPDHEHEVRRVLVGH
jgi:trk system potassium uptake protein TrkA